MAAVDHPGIGRENRFDFRAELLGSRFDPVGTDMIEGVELDERDAEPLRQTLAERRLPATSRSRDHGDALHRSRGSIGVSDPGSTR